MKKRNKAYAYGFKYSKEYKRYREICKRKNVCFTYTGWYQSIKEKYSTYSAGRLLDFEKYLNLKVYKREGELAFVEFVESVIKRIMEMVLPIVALFMSIVACLDSIQESVSDYIQQVNGLEVTQNLADTVKARVDMMGEAFSIVEVGVKITIGFIIPLLCLFLTKNCIRKEIIFFKDYKECIREIRKERSVDEEYINSCCSEEHGDDYGRVSMLLEIADTKDVKKDL